MKKKTPGRPPIDIDPEVVGQMAFDGAKNSEIAAVLGVDDKTIANKFSTILTKKRSARRAALRKKQTDIALRGSVPILIWLGKQELEQREPKQDVEHSGAVDSTVNIRIVRTIVEDKEGNGTRPATA